MAVLITDGDSTRDSLLTLAEAAAAHQAGIQILVIITSSRANRTEYQLISSAPRLEDYQWWSISSIPSLTMVESNVAQEICRPDNGTRIQ